MAAHGSRVDFTIIERFVPENARVLDVGCGDGDLLAYLEETRQIDGRGLELSQAGVNKAVARGLSVVQGDADTDLATYPDEAFDVVILSETLQATQAPKTVLEELLRIGRKVVVTIPNFGHWRARAYLLFTGRMPVTKNLPYTWYDTPNIHFCTLRDFVDLADEVEATITDSAALNSFGKSLWGLAPWFIWNLVAAQGIFLIEARPDENLPP